MLSKWEVKLQENCGAEDRLLIKEEWLSSILYRLLKYKKQIFRDNDNIEGIVFCKGLFLGIEEDGQIITFRWDEWAHSSLWPIVEKWINFLNAVYTAWSAPLTSDKSRDLCFLMEVAEGNLDSHQELVVEI